MTLDYPKPGAAHDAPSEPLDLLPEDVALYLSCDVASSYSPRYAAAGIPLIRSWSVDYEAPRPGSAALASALMASAPRETTGTEDEAFDIPETGATAEPLRLEVRTDPEIFEPYHLEIPLLAAGERLVLDLPALTPAEGASSYREGTATLSIRLGTDKVRGYTFEYSFRLVDPERFTGSQDVPELPLTFVEPDHPYVEQILDQASRSYLAEEEKMGLRGYDGDPLKEAEHIFQAIRRERLIYTLGTAEEPETRGRSYGPKRTVIYEQLIRTITQIAKQHLADSLELAILYAAALEAIGLHAFLVLMKDECLVGAFLKDRHMAGVIHGDVDRLRDLSGEETPGCFVIEASMLAGDGRHEDFGDAVANGRRRLLDTQRIAYCLDVTRGREAGIRPHPSTDYGTTTFRWQHIDMADRAMRANAVHEPLLHVIRDQYHWLQLFSRSIPAMLQAGRRNLAASEHRGGHADDWQDDVPLLRRERTVSSAPRLTASDLFDGMMTLGSVHRWQRPLGEIRIYDLAGRQLSTALDAYAEREDSHLHVPTAFDPEELESWVREVRQEAAIRTGRGEPADLWLALGALAWFDSQSESSREDASRLTPLALLPARLVTTTDGYALLYQTDEMILHPAFPDIVRTLGLPNDLPEQLRRTFPTPEHPEFRYRELADTLRRALRDAESYAHYMDLALVTDMPFRRLLNRQGALSGFPDLSDVALVQPHGDTSEYEPGTTEETAAMRPPVNADDTAPETPQTSPARSHLMPAADELADMLMAPLDSEQHAVVRRIRRGESLVVDGPPASGKTRVLLQALAQNIYDGRSTAIISSGEDSAKVIREALRRHGLDDLVLDLSDPSLSASAVLAQYERMMDFPLVAREADYRARLARWQQLRRELEGYLTWYATPTALGLTPREMLDKRPEDEPTAPVYAWPCHEGGEPVAAMTNEATGQSLEALTQLVGTLATLREEADQHAEAPRVRDVLEQHPWSHVRRVPASAPETAEASIRACHRALKRLHAAYDDVRGPMALRENPGRDLMDSLARFAEAVHRHGIVPPVWFRRELTRDERDALERLRDAAVEQEALEAEIPETFHALATSEDERYPRPSELRRRWDEAELQSFFKRRRHQREIRKTLRAYTDDVTGRPGEEEKAWLKEPALLLQKLSSLEQCHTFLDTGKSLSAHYLSEPSAAAYEDALHDAEIYRLYRTDLRAMYARPGRSDERAMALPDALTEDGQFEAEAARPLARYREAYAAYEDARQHWALWTGDSSTDADETLSERRDRADAAMGVLDRLPARIAYLEARDRVAELGLADLTAALADTPVAQIEAMPPALARACRDAQLRYALRNADLPARTPEELPDLQTLRLDEARAADALSQGASRELRARLSSVLPERLLHLSQSRAMDQLAALSGDRVKGYSVREVVYDLADMIGSLFPAVLISTSTASDYLSERTLTFDTVLADDSDMLAADAYPISVTGAQQVFFGDSEGPVRVPGVRETGDHLVKPNYDTAISLMVYAADQGIPTVKLTLSYHASEDRQVLYRNLRLDHGELESVPAAFHRPRNPIAVRRYRAQAGSAANDAQTLALVIRQELQLTAEQHPELTEARVISDLPAVARELPARIGQLEISYHHPDTCIRTLTEVLVLAYVDPMTSPLFQRRDAMAYWTAQISRATEQTIIIDYDRSSLRAELPYCAGTVTDPLGDSRLRPTSFARYGGRRNWSELLAFASAGSRLRPARLLSQDVPHRLRPALPPEADATAASIRRVLEEEGVRISASMGYTTHRIDLALPGAGELALLIPRGEAAYDLWHVTTYASALHLAGWHTYIVSPWAWKLHPDREEATLRDLIRRGSRS